VLELDDVVVAESPYEAAKRGSKAMVVELGEGNDVALQRVWLLVIHRRHDPLRPHRGSTGT